MTNEELRVRLWEVETELAGANRFIAQLAGHNISLLELENRRRKVYFSEFQSVVKQATDENGRVRWHLFHEYLDEHGDERTPGVMYSTLSSSAYSDLMKKLADHFAKNSTTG
jgi:hypothetical protein